MNAWLLTWEGTSGPAINDRKKIIAILSSKRSSSFVEDLVDVLYCRSVDTASNMAYEANKRKLRNNQYKHIYSGVNRIFYGKNPCIFARVVKDLEIDVDDENNIETVRWTEPTYYESKPPSYKPEVVEPEKSKEIIRPLTALCKDIWE